MPRGKQKSGFDFAGQLTVIIGKLREERAKHADALQKIDDLFSSIGISTHLAPAAPQKRGPSRPPGRKPGRPKKAAIGADALGGSSAAVTGKRKKQKRRTFKTSAPESVLTFVKAGGSKGRTGAEISKHWKTEGRGAGEYVIIGKLVKDKKLKKEKIKDGRGSRYTSN